ncbi:MAG: YfcE family phosphodiesterase [Clostridia bacterium]|nr:YfcE family phosphodiesterase [Clostridia bacterium]
MRIIVFSDSHNNDSNMRRALELNRCRFDLCIHLGDGCREFELLSEEYTDIPFVTVDGNGEDFFGSKRVSETVLDLDGKRIFVTHGHRYNVKFGTTALEYRAVEKECDIVLYGHTHIPDNRYLPDIMGRALYVFNPGSISRQPFGHKPSFGVIEITKAGISLNNAEV